MLPWLAGWRVEAGMLEADLLRLRCRFAEARRVLDATFVTAQALGDERAKRLEDRAGHSARGIPPRWARARL